MSRDALIPEGAAYVPAADALCEQLGVVSMNVYEGHVYAVKRDGTESLLTELLAKANRPEVETSGDGKVTTLKPAPRRTD